MVEYLETYAKGSKYYLLKMSEFLILVKGRELLYHLLGDLWPAYRDSLHVELL